MCSCAEVRGRCWLSSIAVHLIPLRHSFTEHRAADRLSLTQVLSLHAMLLPAHTSFAWLAGQPSWVILFSWTLPSSPGWGHSYIKPHLTFYVGAWDLSLSYPDLSKNWPWTWSLPASASWLLALCAKCLLFSRGTQKTLGTSSVGPRKVFKSLVFILYRL